MALTIAEKKSVLDGRLVDLQHAVESLITAINCGNDKKVGEAFDRVEDAVDSAHDLYDEIYEEELDEMGKELEKNYKED